MLIGLGGAGLLALYALISLLGGFPASGNQELRSVMTWMWGALLVAVLCLPSAVLAVRALMGRKPWTYAGKGRLVFSSLLMLLWPLVLVLARAASGSDLAWLFLPPLLIAVVGIPVLWLTGIARSGLPAENGQRSWGVASFGLVISPNLIVLLQLFVLVAAILVFSLWLVGQPALLAQLQSLGQSFTLDGDPNQAMELMQPYLEQPAVLILGLLFIAGLVPLMEELIKPLGVWFLAGRQLTPAAGFSAGVISGGMFALLESLGYLSAATAEDFILFALARAGTVLLHVTTAGLVGWGLGSALGEKRYLRLGLAYLSAVLLHGFWNAAGILPTLAEFSGFSGPLSNATLISACLLGGLSLLLAVILIVLNRRLRASVL
jgi:hypothetical protein